MGARTTGAEGAVAVAFLAGAAVAVVGLAWLVPLDALAVPTSVCIEEIAACLALFFVFVAVLGPARNALARSRSRVAKLMQLRVGVPLAAKVAAAVLLAFGSFAFAFWALSDVVGGYHGYTYAFFWYPVLASIYNDTLRLIPYVSSRDKGTQSTFYIGLAALGFLALRLNRGVGAAIKDTVTLFLASAVALFELGLWSRAPEDMTWHVTDFLWMGGINDGGYRQSDFLLIPFHNYGPAISTNYVGSYVSGPYYFSNWFVLAVALLLVATRVPGLSNASSRLRRRRIGASSGQAGAPPAPSVGRVARLRRCQSSSLAGLTAQGAPLTKQRPWSWQGAASAGRFESGSSSILAQPS